MSMLRNKKGQKCCPDAVEIESDFKQKLQYTTFCVNGDHYTGSWNGSLKDGKGTYQWHKSGSVYDGDWKDDYRDGFGTLAVKASDGTYRKKYIGSWKFGKRHGFGTNFYSENESYEGEWFCGKRVGWGKMTFADCTVYEGNWDKDKMNGKGILFFPNGHRYEGTFQDGRKHGPGKYYYTDRGQTFEGVWVDNVAKCGEMVDYDRDKVPDATPYPLPVLALANSDKVLDEAKREFIEELSNKKYLSR